MARYVCAAMALAAGACLQSKAGDSPDLTSPQSITITIVPATAIVKVGATQQFGVSFQPTPPDPRIVWSVVDTITASIDASGKLTGLSPGKTTVSATLLAEPSRKAAAQVQVNP